LNREDIIGKGKDKQLDVLKEPGVYVLYRDDEPYYVGKAKDSMRGSDQPARHTAHESPLPFLELFFRLRH
jgi:hypothetical protein